MRRILFGLSLVAIAGSAFGTTEIKEVAKDWSITSTSVSTLTVTALPVLNLSGRYRIRCENVDGVYDVAIGTHSAFTYAINSWVLKSTTVVSGLSQIDLPLNSGTTVYGLGQAQSSQGTVSVRCIEFK